MLNSSSNNDKFVLPVARLVPQQPFNFGNNNNVLLTAPRSAAAKKFNRSKLKVALAVGDTLQLRMERIAAAAAAAAGPVPAVGFGFGAAPAAAPGAFVFGGGGGGGGFGGFGGGGFGGGGFGGGFGAFGAAPGGLNNNNQQAMAQQVNNATHLDWA
jgi:hypothetical protein